MKLITKVEIPELSPKIEYSNKLLFLGSCFSGNIGNKFKDGFFNSLVNPFGVIFNPISIFTLLDRVVNKNYYNDNDWLLENDRYVNLELHGDLSFSNLEEANKNTNALLDEVYAFLTTTNYLFLTFGTAWVYDYIEQNKLVANCHKIPQKKFNKRLLSVDEIFSKAEKSLSALSKINASLKVVFTVSPVRHLADGAHQNNISKSTLLLFIDRYQKQYASLYFPSYEIVMDELRDYRFFNVDMIHPNSLATNYVWEIMQKNWISDNSNKLYEQVSKLKKAALHRPFNIKSIAHQKFLKNTVKKIEEFQKNNKNIDLQILKDVIVSQQN